MEEENPLVRKFYGRVPFKGAASLFLFEKSGKVQRMLHAIKYQQQKELARHLGKVYAEDLNKTGFFDQVDVIVPVPLHEKKLRRRGFNQSEWFAKGLSEGIHKPVDTAGLVRIKDTGTQTRKKRYERWENVDGIFGLTDPASFSNRHILLADDVITTGATLEAAWQALKKADGIRISLCSIAFASGIN
jgi:ComF family protein